MPRAIAAASGDVTRTSRPSTRIAPAVAGVMPNSVSARLGAPRPDQAGEADDLAGAQIEGDVAHHVAMADPFQVSITLPVSPCFGG